MAGTAGHVLDIARSQLGKGETPPGSNCQPYSHAWGHGCEAWCADFACYCLRGGGALDVPMSAAAQGLLDNYKRAGRFGSSPRVGAVVFFRWPGDSISHHVELVEATRAGGSIVTLGGNVSDQVRRVVRQANIVGYGYPRYAAPTPAPGKPGTHHPAAHHHTSVLHRGDHGHDVLDCQALLNAHGASPALAKDGVFGPRTQAAVVSFQRHERIKVDGVVGPQTWGRLER